MGTLEVDKLDPQSGTALEIGTSGDTVTVPSGVTLTVAGALNVTGTTALADGTVNIAELDIDGGTDIGEAIVDADLFVIDNGAGGTNRKTAASRLTTYILGANSIDSDMYVDGSIDTAHIANDQITAALMADNSIDSDMYVDGSIDTAHIANDQITAAFMADNSIDSDMYVDGSIDTAEIADNAITLAKMASGTDGNLITYDASGNPAAVATGSSGQLLTSAGSGAPPTFTTVSSGTDWQSVITSATTMVSGRGYFVNMTSGVITMTLPASPSLGDYVTVIDAYNLCSASNNMTIGRNNKPIDGATADLTVDTAGAAFTLVFCDNTRGWIFTDRS